MGRYGLATAQGGIGAFKAFATYRAGQARNMMAKYNAKIIEQEGRARDLAMKEQGRRLAQDQRGLKATQRMSVAGRGGLESGTDLLTLADEAEKMQLDQLELMRQREINTRKTRHEAYMTKWQGKQRLHDGLRLLDSQKTLLERLEQQWEARNGRSTSTV
jgi:membrane-bound lytic murein transglycosylase B